MSVWKWVVLCFVVLYGVMGFIGVPYLILNKTPQIVTEQTGGALYIGDAAFNPFSFELTVNDIYFTPPDNTPFISLKAFTLNYDLYALLTGKLQLSTIALVRPNVHLVKTAEGTFNFSWLQELGNHKEAAPKSEGASELPPIKIQKFVISDGRIHYTDASKPRPFEVSIAPLEFQLRDIDTTNNGNARDRIRLSARFDDGGSFNLNSRILSIEPFALEGTVDYEAGKLFTGWRYLQEQLKLEVADGKLNMHARFHIDTANLEAMRIDNLQLALNKLRIIPKDAVRHHDILSIKSLRLNDGFIEPMRQKIRLDTLRIDDVGIAAVRRQNGRVDWQEYVTQAGTSRQEHDTNRSAPDSESPPWDLLLNHFVLNNLHVNFEDRAVTPKTTFQVNRFDFKADHISSLPQTSLHYAMEMQLNKTMNCRSEGELAHSKLNARGDFGCEGVDVTWFNPYIDQAASAALQRYDLYVGSGVSHFHLNYSAQEDATIAFDINNTTLSLEQFALKQKLKNTTLFSMKTMHFEGISANTATQEAHIKSLGIKKPYLYASLDRNGVLNWNHVVVPKKSSASKAKQAPATDAAPWHLLLKEFTLQNGNVHFKDHTLAKAHSTKLNALDVALSNVDSAAKTSLRYRASTRLNRHGRISARGTLQHTPLLQQGTLNLRNVHLEDFSPYVAKDHHIALKRGLLNLKSSLKYAPSQTRADAQIKGALSITDFVLEESRNNTVLLAWDAIDVAPLSFEYNPNKLFVKEIDINGLYANAIIDANGTMNFAQLSRHPQAATVSKADETSKESESPFAVQIVKIMLHNSSANFEDNSLPLRFKAYIHDFKGDIYGISSNQQEISSLELNGVVNQYGSAKLKGSFNAAAIEKFTDLNLVFRNIDLVNMSPYSGKFIGQRIANGKLFLDLNYDIVDSQMVGENSIIVKKLELGEDVESKDAINLPLGLAIALLEDSDGIIDLELPVSGDMNNPEFSYGHIIFQAFINLITKAVTAPFSFLGSMLGIDGEALARVEFEPGSSMILPPEQEKLDKLAKALIKRPKLKLALHGTFSEIYDAKALKEAKLLARAVALAKEEGDLFEGDVRQETLETLYEELIGEDALETLEERLEAQYKENVDALAKAYDAQMINDLSNVQNVSAAELNALAQERADVIKNYLVQSKNIQSERVEIAATGADDSSEGKWIQTKMDLVVE
ncbi:MAG: hypothetical protein DSZ03_02570 [Sulfurimonas sp.]|nr:MAG: hypothetical protein DSZ03_02570 [Sulfurimonas sp.]